MNYDIPGWTTVRVEHFGNLTRVTYRRGDLVMLANAKDVTLATLPEVLAAFEEALNG